MVGSTKQPAHVPQFRMNEGPILLSPDIRTGNGLGHLIRCVALAEESPASYRIHIPEPPERQCRGYHDLCAVPGLGNLVIESDSAPETRYQAVVYDRRSLDAAHISGRCMTVGVDLGGSGRDYVDYLVDILPTPPGSTQPNASLPHLLPAPENRRAEPPTRITRVLLAFGGEDPTHLTSQVYRALRSSRLSNGRQVTLVRGPANDDPFPEDATVLDGPSHLRELLADFDLIVTSFGLTAIEGLRAGCAVVAVDPSPYHHRLSRAAGLTTAGVGRVDIRALARVLRFPAIATAEAAASRSPWTTRLFEVPKGSLHQVLSSLVPGGPTQSPVTGKKMNRVVARFQDRSYYVCRDTGLLFLRRFDDFSMDYGHDYFFSDYQQQYGRTYLDDFSHIRKLAAPRLDRIQRLARTGAVLDVGCAFGPFLDAARERGYEPFGLDIASEAAAYVDDELGIPALAGDLLQTEAHSYASRFGRSRFDVLTMWYVIEHFPDLAAVLQRVHSLLRQGGVFAFSTPNASGISGRKSMRGFLYASPADHFTIWSPRTAARVLARFGFRVQSVRVTGHHPERFGAFVKHPGSVVGTLAGGVSRLFRLGDTFEVYAVKTGEVLNG